MSVLMLQSFTRQGGTPGRATDEETTGPLGQRITLDDRPESSVVAKLDQMGEFVDDDVVDHPIGELDESIR